MVGSAVARLVLSSEPMNTGSIMPMTITRASLWESEVIGADWCGHPRELKAFLGGWFFLRRAAASVLEQRFAFDQPRPQIGPMPPCCMRQRSKAAILTADRCAETDASIKHTGDRERPP